MLFLADGILQVGDHSFVSANSNQNWTRVMREVDSGPWSGKDIRHLWDGGMGVPDSGFALSVLVSVH